MWSCIYTLLVYRACVQKEQQNISAPVSILKVYVVCRSIHIDPIRHMLPRAPPPILFTSVHCSPVPRVLSQRPPWTAKISTNHHGCRPSAEAFLCRKILCRDLPRPGMSGDNDTKQQNKTKTNKKIHVKKRKKRSKIEGVHSLFLSPRDAWQKEKNQETKTINQHTKGQGRYGLCFSHLLAINVFVTINSIFSNKQNVRSAAASFFFLKNK